MKKIISNTEILKFLPSANNINYNQKFRLFSFCVKTIYNNEVLVFNTLTRQMIVLNKEEYSSVLNNEDTEIRRDLIKDCFLVPENFDDNKLKEQILSLSKLFAKSCGLNHYVIFPTMDCNARCFYCFEHGANKNKMENKVAEDVADFIIKKSYKNGIKIQWFGGEPLYNTEAIDIISDKLLKTGLPFKSIMISNGYLFDENVINKAKNKWNLKQVQITLDGTEKIYNRVKNYIYNNDESPFYRVLNNIELLIKNGIKVLVRLNMDKYNKEDLFELVTLLYERFKNYADLLTVYAWLLYDNRGANKTIRDDDERHRLTEDLLELEEYIKKCGFILKALPDKNIGLYSCMADNPNSAVILPDGRLGKCDHHSDDELYGSIYSDDIDLGMIKSWTEKREPVELCKDCPIAPECKRLKKCPDDGSFDCDIYEQRRRVRKVENQMLNAYKKYLNEQQHKG